MKAELSDRVVPGETKRRSVLCLVPVSLDAYLWESTMGYFRWRTDQLVFRTPPRVDLSAPLRADQEGCGPQLACDRHR